MTAPKLSIAGRPACDGREHRPSWPICDGCGAEIIGVEAKLRPWSIVVCDPFGRQSEGGAFCLPCMVELAKHGVRLHPVHR